MLIAISIQDYNLTQKGHFRNVILGGFSMTATLQFPNQMPDEYLQIDKEPVFNASKHLQLEPPKTVTSLKELG